MKSLLLLLKMVNYYRIMLRFRFKSMFQQYEWRKMNSHNSTVIDNPVTSKLFPVDKVKVGRFTYGTLSVLSYSEDDGNLFIGDFCSIADEVRFLLGGNHDYKCMSTFPFKAKILNKNQCEAMSKGNIIIEDDVWIGHGAIILSGVHIGRGAIIGAMCVVSKDVKPFEIVVGNPMKVLKKRFNDNIIRDLLTIDLSKFDKNTIIENLNILYSHIDENVDNILAIKSFRNHENIK